MARVVLVDGYNVIGSEGRFRRNREILEKERMNLVRQLSEYRSRLEAGTEILLVFDGFASDRDRSLTKARGGVTVLFSEEEGTADAVLIRLAERYREKAIVVSSDREVLDQSGKSGARTIGAREFMQRVGARVLPQSSVLPAMASMKEESDDSDVPPKNSRKRGNPRRLSKKERSRRRTLDTL